MSSLCAQPQRYIAHPCDFKIRQKPRLLNYNILAFGSLCFSVGMLVLIHDALIQVGISGHEKVDKATGPPLSLDSQIP